jgi:hypothetical protein
MLVAMCQEIDAWLFCFYCIDYVGACGLCKEAERQPLGWCGAPSEQRVWKTPTLSRRSDEMRGTPKIISKICFFAKNETIRTETT